MLADAVQHRGGTVPLGNSRLPEEVTRKQSHHWQRIATLPESVFEEELARDEPSTAALAQQACAIVATAPTAPIATPT